MRKLALKLEDLSVETFETVPEDRSRGTVLGADDDAALFGSRVTRCGSGCNACTYTNCYPDQQTYSDCAC